MYVIDATGLIALEARASEVGASFRDLLSTLTTLAESGDLVCPPLVVAECRRLGATDLITSWIRAAQGHFSDASPSWDLAAEVLAKCPGLIHPDDTEESSQVEVLALAIARQRTQHDVVVVTEQWDDLPDRSALGPVAFHAGVCAISTPAFVARLTQ